MTAPEARALADFTRRALRTRENTRDGGGWKKKPATFLIEQWKPALIVRRKEKLAAAAKDPATSADVLAGMLARLEPPPRAVRS